MFARFVQEPYFFRGNARVSAIGDNWPGLPPLEVSVSAFNNQGRYMLHNNDDDDNNIGGSGRS